MRSPFAAAVASLLLAGCASLQGPDMPQQSPETRWLARRAALEQIDRFSLQARIAGSGSLGMKGELRWQQKPDGSFDLRLSGPFGAGAVSIAGTAAQVEVRSREGRQLTTDPELWIRQRFGWSLPVGGLRYWALGLPAPQSPASIELDPDGAIAVLEQDGWRLEYDEYQPAGPLSLPRRLQLVNHDVTLKLIADRWDDLPVATDGTATPAADATQPPPAP